MSLIEPQPQVERVSVNLEVEIARLLRAYSARIRSTPEWTVNRALRYFFSRDREFQRWLADQPPAAGDDAPLHTPVGRPKDLS